MRWLYSDILEISLGPGSTTVERTVLRMLRLPRRSPQPAASPLRRGPEVQPRPLGAAGGGTRGDDASSTGSRSPVRLRTESGGRGSRSVLYTRRGRSGRGFAAARASADPPHLRRLFFLSLQAPWLWSGPGRCEALAAGARLVGVGPARGPGPWGARSGQCRAEHAPGAGDLGATDGWKGSGVDVRRGNIEPRSYCLSFLGCEMR